MEKRGCDNEREEAQAESLERRMESDKVRIRTPKSFRSMIIFNHFSFLMTLTPPVRYTFHLVLSCLRNLRIFYFLRTKLGDVKEDAKVLEAEFICLRVVSDNKLLKRVIASTGKKPLLRKEQ